MITLPDQEQHWKRDTVARAAASYFIFTEIKQEQALSIYRYYDWSHNSKVK